MGSGDKKSSTGSGAGGSRGARGYAGLRLDGTLSVFGSTWLIGAIGLVIVLHARPWYEPQYAIPIMGMILGNTLTGVGLALAIGLSRVFLGVHWFSDVLGGWLLGAAWACATMAVLSRPIRRS